MSAKALPLSHDQQAAITEKGNSMRATEAKRPRDGSRKAKVYDLYQETTKEAAIAYGLSLGLKESTIRSWIGTWKKGRAIQDVGSD
jgi:hypothetical protein